MNKFCKGQVYRQAPDTNWRFKVAELFGDLAVLDGNNLLDRDGKAYRINVHFFDLLERYVKLYDPREEVSDRVGQVFILETVEFGSKECVITGKSCGASMDGHGTTWFYRFVGGGPGPRRINEMSLVFGRTTSFNWVYVKVKELRFWEQLAEDRKKFYLGVNHTDEERILAVALFKERVDCKKYTLSDIDKSNLTLLREGLLACLCEVQERKRIKVPPPPLGPWVARRSARR